MESPENVNIQCDHVLQFLNAFKSQQHDQLDDESLFYDHLSKCRCCFMQLTEIRGANTIDQWQRDTFMDMTGLYLSSGRHLSNDLCLNCIELLTIFTQMKVAADGMRKVQNRYIEHNRKLFEVVTVKQEVENDSDDPENVAESQTNETNNQTEVGNNIDDQEYENDINIAAAEFNHDEVATDQIEGSAELIDKMPECSVVLERLDPMTIEQYSSNRRANESDSVTTTTILTDHTDSSTAVTNVFSCDLCGFETEIKEFLTHHIDSRHKQADELSDNKFKCPIDGCNKICKSRNCLYMHRYNVHNRDSQEKTTCHDCGKVCKNKTLLKKHQQTHNKKVKCHICGKSFALKTQLIDHRQTYHIKNINFTCTKCSKIFKSQYKLKQHQRNTHDTKKFKCNQCNAAFAAPYLLADHVKLKHEDKRFHCSYPGCSKKFSRKDYPAIHLRVVHKLIGDEFEKYCELIKMH